MSFAEQGYVVVPLFDPAIVRGAQQDIVDQIDRVSRALYLPFEASCPDEPLATRIDRVWAGERSAANLLRVAICTDAHRGPRLSAMATSPDLLRAAEELAGEPLEQRTFRIRASIAAFPGERHAWHSDVAYVDDTACGRVRVTAWIPLSDAGPESGGLELIAGRNTEPFEHRRDKGFSIDEATLADRPRVQPVCPAGSALLLDRFTPHRTLPPGPEARFALVVWMNALG